MAKPAARDTSDTRDALIDAATLELAEKGLDSASLDSICARAGFTRGAFYVHFADRDELLVAVLDRVLTRYQERLMPDGVAADLRSTIVRYVAMVGAGDAPTVGTPSWRFRHTLGAVARVPAVRDKYLALQQRGAERIARATRAGQHARTVRDDIAAETIGEILTVLSLGISAAVEIGMPLDLLAGGAAIEKLLAPPPRARVRAARPPRRAPRTRGR
ncbi:MAG TPA: TetR/AcrR family transcriptional regulator [Kofleriaceae bacterium]|nr:TetR/AcrR family transcriptional regulator [Kofleriaceae bacterium]